MALRNIDTASNEKEAAIVEISSIVNIHVTAGAIVFILCNGLSLQRRVATSFTPPCPGGLGSVLCSLMFCLLIVDGVSYDIVSYGNTNMIGTSEDHTIAWWYLYMPTLFLWCGCAWP